MSDHSEDQTIENDNDQHESEIVESDHQNGSDPSPNNSEAKAEAGLKANSRTESPASDPPENVNTPPTRDSVESGDIGESDEVDDVEVDYSRPVSPAIIATDDLSAKPTDLEIPESDEDIIPPAENENLAVMQQSGETTATTPSDHDATEVHSGGLEEMSPGNGDETPPSQNEDMEQQIKFSIEESIDPAQTNIVDNLPDAEIYDEQLISRQPSTDKMPTQSTPREHFSYSRALLVQPGFNSTGETPTYQEPPVGRLLPPIKSNKKPTPQPHEVSYRAMSPFLRNPFYSPSAPITCPKLCCDQSQWLTTIGYTGPDRKKQASEKRWLKHHCLENRSVSATLSKPNPAATVPMRPRKWKRKSWMDPPENIQEWKVNAEKEEARKDHENAVKLGCETLVGNLVYCDIPGAKDLNRSWKHFLDPDPLAWGFPYPKGSRERPALPLPPPYLVHQLKEQLWKWPRNKLIISHTPPPSIKPGASTAVIGRNDY